ncbi:hypervirulence associated TUDOR domain-containing protein [Spirosoma endbachense]|uniref:Hypervirulence associated protein TUDOR domain-containing protein n=1 Tax=Spirosoma endbachense TaxID=2666025 RepID=A0A6P1VSH6_9BACT|nr:DUF2945 domain-containing protein [Spirosoma endbachense]QHV94316.1 hypothetical protein GJR95_04455 [Spirosoma endbachense]
MTTAKKGDNVKWKYGKSEGVGKVSEVHQNDVKKTIKGKSIKRKGSQEEPALVIRQADGQEVIKSASEVDKK